MNSQYFSYSGSIIISSVKTEGHTKNVREGTIGYFSYLSQSTYAANVTYYGPSHTWGRATFKVYAKYIDTG